MTRWHYVLAGLMASIAVGFLFAAMCRERAINADKMGMAMDLVDEEDMRVGVLGRGRKVDRIISTYKAI